MGVGETGARIVGAFRFGCQKKSQAHREKAQVHEANATPIHRSYSKSFTSFPCRRKSVPQPIIPLSQSLICDRLISRRPLWRFARRNAFDEGIPTRSEEHWNRITIDLRGVDDAMLSGQVAVVRPTHDDVSCVHKERAWNVFDQAPILTVSRFSGPALGRDRPGAAGTA